MRNCLIKSFWFLKPTVNTAVMCYGFRFVWRKLLTPSTQYIDSSVTRDMPVLHTALSYRICYITNSICRFLPEKLTSPLLSNKLPAFYGTRVFIAAFTRHLSLSGSIQSRPPSSTPWIATVILSSYLCLRLPSFLLPSGLPTKSIDAPPFPHICQVPTLYFSSRFHHPNNMWWAVHIKLLIM